MLVSGMGTLDAILALCLFPQGLVVADWLSVDVDNDLGCNEGIQCHHFNVRVAAAVCCRAPSTKAIPLDLRVAQTLFRFDSNPLARNPFFGSNPLATCRIPSFYILISP